MIGKTLLISLLVLVCTVLADNEGEDTQAVSLIKENSLTWSRATILGAVTAAVVITVAIAAVMVLYFPLGTYNICYLLGLCNYQITSEGNPRHKRSEAHLHPALESLSRAYDKYGRLFGPQQKSVKVEKRSVEYVGPILQTLAAAYEEYSELGEKKNTKKIRPYTN